MLFLVQCCYGDLCNDGSSTSHSAFVQIGNKVSIPGAGNWLSNFYGERKKKIKSFKGV